MYSYTQTYKCSRTSEIDGTGSLVRSLTYLDRLTELKSLLKLFKDWYRLIYSVHNMTTLNICYNFSLVDVPDLFIGARRSET